jgi:hypothetical protein
MTVQPHAPSRVLFDVASTVLVVYGKQKQARIGYNPITHGRPSYHPLLCFEGQSQDFGQGEWRPGDAHTASGTRTLLTACFAKVPAGVWSVIVRVDTGFYDHALVEWLEAHQAGLVTGARLTPPIKRKLRHLRDVSLSRGVEVAECRYQPTRWPHPCRFVVIRPPQPEDLTDQLMLFKLGKYHYQVLVTNLPLHPLNLRRFYNDRTGVELLISNSSRETTPYSGLNRVFPQPARGGRAHLGPAGEDRLGHLTLADHDHPRRGTCWRCQRTSRCIRRRSPTPNEEYFMLSSRIFHVERLWSAVGEVQKESGKAMITNRIEVEIAIVQHLEKQGSCTIEDQGWSAVAE